MTAKQDQHPPPGLRRAALRHSVNGESALVTAGLGTNAAQRALGQRLASIDQQRAALGARQRMLEKMLTDLEAAITAAQARWAELRERMAHCAEQEALLVEQRRVVEAQLEALQRPAPPAELPPGVMRG